MILKKKILKGLLVFTTLCSLQAVHAMNPGPKQGKITFSFPKEFDAHVKIGPSTFIFAASCASFALFYHGIKKISEGAAHEQPEATQEGWYLMSGGAALLAAVALCMYGYQKYSEEPVDVEN